LRLASLSFTTSVPQQASGDLFLVRKDAGYRLPPALALDEGTTVVTPPAQIGILGAPQSGKTQLAYRIEAALTGRGLTVVRTTDVSRLAAASRGLPTLRQQTDQTTEWMISQDTADEIAAAARGCDVVLVDGVSFSAVAGYLAAVELWGEQPDAFATRRFSRLVSDRAVAFDLLLATVFAPAEDLSVCEPADTRFSHLVDNHVHTMLLGEKSPYLAVSRSEESQTIAIKRATEVAVKAVSAA
jgi:hypothetical protein